MDPDDGPDHLGLCADRRHVALLSETVDPYINLIYGWTPTKKLTICGSTGYLGRREHFDFGPLDAATASSDSTNRSSRSLGGRTNHAFLRVVYLDAAAPAINRALELHGRGLLYQLTPNMQLDLRAGSVSMAILASSSPELGFSVRF